MIFKNSQPEIKWGGDSGDKIKCGEFSREFLHGKDHLKSGGEMFVLLGISGRDYGGNEGKSEKMNLVKEERKME